MLVEESVRGWDEFELEVMRDRLDNVVVVCSIENLDPMGVHTGDSVTVAPQMTLPDEAYQELRDAAAAVIRAVGVETGGSNIQFARDRVTGDVRVIEMNPRVSRSSALASKATGYPIAKVAAKLAMGYTLDEIPNDMTKTTPASFEPTLDYVVVKFPRFAFEKFPGADPTLGTQMKSVGEAMGIGRTFSEAFLKAFGSRELDPGAPTPWATFDDIPDGVHPWFKEQLALARRELASRDIARAKRAGWGDDSIGAAWGTSGEEVRRARYAKGIRPSYRRVDSCAGEVEAGSNYYYSTWGEEDEAPPLGDKPRAVIIGSGPNRIGQGIEFDYCCVHAAQTFRRLGYEAVMVNCNPETVSTDYDTSDRLYFEPLTPEEVLAVLDRERPEGVVTQFGGQTPLRLARFIEAAGYRILGTPHAAIDLAEDRERFGALAAELGVRCPPWATVEGEAEALAAAAEIGYPVLVRPSYVLGGRAMRICDDEEQLRAAMAAVSGPVLVDRFVENAIEIDVDALCDGEEVFIAAVMQHVEEAGVHSGDSACVLPAQSLTLANALEVEHVVKRLGPALGVVGLLNVQLAVADQTVYVLEANPRASRTVPFASKAIGINLVDAACRLAAGETLSRPRAEDAATAGDQRQGGRAAVRPLPGRRSRARAGDALHRRGDGQRVRSPDRLREGGAGSGAATADQRHGVPLGQGQRQARRRSRRGRPRRARVRARRDGRDGRDAAQRRARGGRGGQGRRGGRRPADGRRPDPPASLRPRGQHSAGLGRSRRRLPDPRGGARRARPVHHDDRRRRRGRPRDRQRSRRDGAVAARAHRRRVSGVATDRPAIGGARRERARVLGTRSDRAVHARSVSNGAGSSRESPGQLFMLEAPGRVLPRAFSLCLAPDGELGFLIDPIGPGTRALAGLAAGDAIHVLGPLGQRLRPLGRATAARRRRDRDRAASVPVRAAGWRHRRCSASAARGTPRQPPSFPAQRSCSTRRWSRRRCRRSRATCSRAGRSRCFAPWLGSCRAPSWPGRPRWPAGTAPATAAWWRSRGATGVSAWTGRCIRGHEVTVGWLVRPCRSSTPVGASTRSPHPTSPARSTRS